MKYKDIIIGIVIGYLISQMFPQLNGLAKKAGKTEYDFDKNELDFGTEIEMEHTSNKNLARKIAMDHLTEDKNYYKKLKIMEESH